MINHRRPGLSGNLKSIAESAWFAYSSIALLQVKVMLWIWQHRDLAPGDTSYYYVNVFNWLDKGQASFVGAPLYTLFLAFLHSVIGDPFQVLVVAQIAIAVCASLLTLALMRRLLAKHIAWMVAAWWAVLAINFDTIYNVHLFSALFPLAIFLIAARSDSLYGRGLVLAGLLFAAALVRLEYGALFFLWLLLFVAFEVYARLTGRNRHSAKTFLLAYGVPLLLVSLIIGVFYGKSIHTYAEIEKRIEAKQTLNVGQIYAFNRRQQGDSWQGDYWTDYPSIMERDFGQPSVTFSQALRINPRAMLKHFWWNIKLIPSGTQLALFNHYSSGPNPDYIRARQSQLVWVPFLLVVGLCTYAAASVLIKRRTTGNPLPWLLLLSAACFVLGLMVTQRPRPSYMFPYTTFVMALTGLGLQRLLELVRTNLFTSYWPLAGIPLILFVPSYYDTNYTNHYGYKGQPLRERYERFAPHLERTAFGAKAVFITPGSDEEILCNYLGLTCLEVEMESARAIDRLPARIDDALGGEPVDNVYVLYLEDMIWNFIPPTGRQNGNSMGYVELSCFSRAGDILTCSDGIIDLDKGVMISGSDEIPLRAAFFVNDGYVVERKDFAVEHGYYLQIVMKQNKVNMILVADEPLFRSNFNQQYLLGNYDRHTFSEVYNASPTVRVLKVNERMPMIMDEKKTQGKFRSAR